MAQPASNKPDQKIWCWQSSGGFKPYEQSISSEIDRLKVGESYTMSHGYTKYVITKISNDSGKQMNPKTNFHRDVILKSINNTTNSNIQIDGWYWQRSNGDYAAFDNNISSQIGKLQIGQVYSITVNNNKYDIKKVSHNKCEQTNVENGYKRDVIYQSTHNPQTYKWFWRNSRNEYIPYSDEITQEIERLKINETFSFSINNSRSEIIKLTNNQCQQKNVDNNYSRPVIRKIIDDKKQNGDNDVDMKDNTDAKEECLKWYWQAGNGEFKPISNDISKQLTVLKVGATKTIKINHLKYDFKKLSIKHCVQRNVGTNKMRNVRMAEYGWFYLSSDKSLKLYAKDLNDKLNSTKIGASFTFKLDSNKQYCVKRISLNKAEQTNVLNGFSRPVVKKMTLNNANNANFDEKRKKVGKMFYSTVSASKYKIVEMEEIANNFTIDIYEKLLESKCKNGKKRKDEERLLWHGTKVVHNLKLIISNGFDRSFNTTAAYGKGTYFARDAIYSVHGGYCGHDNKGVHYILLCKVITGEYIVGNSAMKTIPRKPDGSEYESLVNNVNDPSVFVIWRDYHAVPYFLVKYKRK